MLSVNQILKQYWGYDQFRPLQEDIIGAIANGQDALVIMPTGGGKSLCYQIPALMKEGFCLVISPLIALMEDQVARLKELGIKAACIHSGLNYSEVRQIMENMQYGSYKLLYISPERLQTSLFQDYLPEFDINLIAVDEAHCIAQWGYDFRPDYLKIATIRDVHPNVPILALTASATVEIIKEIEASLQLNKIQIFEQSLSRNNVFYEVKYTERKQAETFEVIDKVSSSIIYCRSRKQTEELARQLEKAGKTLVFYHAGISKDKRSKAQQQWLSGSAQTIVATTAFGMGIDKKDVRLVLHYDAPEHLEAYYQEAGRCGRDGLPAKAITVYNQIDINRLEQSTSLHFPPDAYLRQAYQSVVEYLQIPIGAVPNRYYAFDLADFCKKFDLNMLQASYALRLLQQEGLWTITESVYNPATIQFICDRSVIDRLANIYPFLHYLATGLLRQYGNIFHYPATVRATALARQLKVQKADVEKGLEQLKKMNIADYQPQTDNNQLFFHHYRVDSRHLLIDNERINLLKQRHIARTQAMIAYLENTTECRERMIKTYFGEPAPTDCGHCDVCVSKLTARNKTDDLRNEIVQLLLAKRSASIHLIIAHFPAYTQTQIISMVREMVDGKVLDIENNIVTLL